MKQNTLETSLNRVPFETIILGIVAGIISGLIFEPIAGILIFTGALVATVSFVSLKSFIDRYLSKQKSLVLRRAILMYSVRLMLICLVFLIIIFVFKGRAVAFMAGFSLIVISVLIEAIRNLAYVN
jgi:DMSO/TMAO reductase YedYZ heme-binding membrane subunit